MERENDYDNDGLDPSVEYFNISFRPSLDL